ncbi:MAG: hypothetical protein K2L39_01415 [Muribaculaceae bacterium]|nr:hypothetical protein [Muribaculaceae bacterium]
MKNDSTQLFPSAMKSAAPRRRRPQGLSPRRSTILFLRQYARAYSCVATLPSSLGSFVAN